MKYEKGYESGTFYFRTKNYRDFWQNRNHRLEFLKTQHKFCSLLSKEVWKKLF